MMHARDCARVQDPSNAAPCDCGAASLEELHGNYRSLFAVDAERERERAWDEDARSVAVALLRSGHRVNVTNRQTNEAAPTLDAASLSWFAAEFANEMVKRRAERK